MACLAARRELAFTSKGGGRGLLQKLGGRQVILGVGKHSARPPGKVKGSRQRKKVGQPRSNRHGKPIRPARERGGLTGQKKYYRGRVWRAGHSQGD